MDDKNIKITAKKAAKQLAQIFEEYLASLPLNERLARRKAVSDFIATLKSKR